MLRVMLCFHRHGRQNSLALAVFGHQRQTRADGLRGRLDLRPLTTHEDLPAIDLVDAENGARHLSASGADQPGDSQNFTPAQVEADAVQHAFAPQILHPQDFLSRLDTEFGKLVLQIASDHHANEFVDRGAGNEHGAHFGAIAQNGGAIADSLHFFQAMGNVNNGNAALLEILDHLEKMIDFVGRQHRRRLVHDDDSAFNERALAISTICCCAMPKRLTMVSGSTWMSKVDRTSRVC